MKYEINKPESELTEGYFTLALKYITLFIIGWIGGWIFLMFVSRGKRSELTDLLFNNTEYTRLQFL